MRWCAVFLVLLQLTSSAASAHESLPAYNVTLTSLADVERIEATGAMVDAVQDGTATVFVPAAAQAAFEALGLRYALVPETVPEKGTSGYHSYAGLTSHLQQLATDNPGITRLQTLGKSVEGREIWALLVSDNPEVEEDEPEFKYISTMHGDEPVGTELLLNFLEELLASYGNQARRTRLVDETAMWFVPVMNPDGLEHLRRTNVNGFDLNRAFPEFPSDYDGTVFDELVNSAGRQPEVRSVMEWSAANSFVLAANFHGGSVVVNYPYDEDGVPSGAYAEAPDDALFRELSLLYADRNPPMSNSPFFQDGITNGSAWYSILGGMQDWNYRFLGCLEVTIELSTPKRPPADTLPQYWEDNRDSMWAYLEAVHRGVRGLVTDRRQGAPLWCAVRVEENPQPVFTDPDVGDYHRILLPGTHTLTYAAPGYFPYRVQGVIVGEGDAVRRDVALSNGDINGDELVNALDIQLVVSAALGQNTGVNADVNGGGVTATDVQGVVNVALGRPIPEE